MGNLLTPTAHQRREMLLWDLALTQYRMTWLDFMDGHDGHRSACNKLPGNDSKSKVCLERPAIKGCTGRNTFCPACGNCSTRSMDEAMHGRKLLVA